MKRCIADVVFSLPDLVRMEILKVIGIRRPLLIFVVPVLLERGADEATLTSIGLVP